MSGYCSQCSTGLPLGAQFCPRCGAQTGAAAVGWTAPPNQMGYQQSGYPQTAYAYPAGPQRSAWEWMTLPLKRYADFSGRSQRQEYWMFYLLNIIAYVILAGIALAGFPWSKINEPNAEPGVLLLIGMGGIGLWFLATFVPNLAVTVRRLHDQDKTGWLILFFVILKLLFSVLGWIVQIIFMCIEGTRGDNSYGPDPKGIGNADIFS